MVFHTPRKRFGQHFLKDDNILQEMMRCLSLQKTECVVEIGPGQGALTRYLLSEVDHLFAVELDRDLIARLQTEFGSRLSVFSADALNFSFTQLSPGTSDLRVVGNLPYNISTPLLFHLFSQQACIRDMHFMLQKEVVERLTAPVGSTHYNRLSVMSQYFCDSQYLLDVPPEAFDPPPQVDSAVVRLIPRRDTMLSEARFAAFSSVVKEAFNYRRKKLGNCLKRFMNSAVLSEIGIDPNARPQEITVAEFIRISEAIKVN